MCNIIRTTRKKEVVVYKLVFKEDNKYYSYFAGTPVRIGKVESQSKYYIYPKAVHGYYHSKDNHFNELMVGKCSGFVRLKDALLLFNTDMPITGNIFILRIVLTTNIVIGNTINIDNFIFVGNEYVYAGEYIKEIKEIKLKKKLIENDITKS